MALLSLEPLFTGQVGVNPRLVRMQATDSLATITTAGYLDTAIKRMGITLYPTDFIFCNYDATLTSFGIFYITTSGGVNTLNKYINPGNVTLPTIANHIAVFNGTTGVLAEDVATAINGGNIQAGLSGTAGYFAAFPATASRGSLRFVAANNAGNTVTQITNASFGQASVLTIPDPATATANFVMAPAALVNNNLVKASGTAGLTADAGFRIIANTTAAYAGGGTNNVFVATGLAATSKGTAVIRASTNSVSITKALPGANTLDITFSADPGAATTVDYIYSTAAV